MFVHRPSRWQLWKDGAWLLAMGIHAGRAVSRLPCLLLKEPWPLPLFQHPPPRLYHVLALAGWEASTQRLSHVSTASGVLKNRAPKLFVWKERNLLEEGFSTGRYAWPCGRGPVGVGKAFKSR